MTDKELLVLAAKAARYYAHRMMPDVPDFPKDWNPLEDDGDAFRLALTVPMDLHLIRRTAVGIRLEGWHDRTNTLCAPKDRAKTLRRAIVMAAAELAEDVPKLEKHHE